jgi:hypothetical protein
VSPPSPPSPLPPARERGAEGGVRALSPRACALGYDLAPLTGLGNGRPQGGDFVSQLLTQDTRSLWIKTSCKSVERLHLWNGGLTVCVKTLAVAPVYLSLPVTCSLFSRPCLSGHGRGQKAASAVCESRQSREKHFASNLDARTSKSGDG